MIDGALCRWSSPSPQFCFSPSAGLWPPSSISNGQSASRSSPRPNRCRVVIQLPRYLSHAKNLHAQNLHVQNRHVLNLNLKNPQLQNLRVLNLHVRNPNVRNLW